MKDKLLGWGERVWIDQYLCKQSGENFTEESPNVSKQFENESKTNKSGSLKLSVTKAGRFQVLADATAKLPQLRRSPFL